MIFRELDYEIYEASILICFPIVPTIKVTKYILNNGPTIYSKYMFLILSYKTKGDGLC